MITYRFQKIFKYVVECCVSEGFGYAECLYLDGLTAEKHAYPFLPGMHICIELLRDKFAAVNIMCSDM